MSKTRIAAAAAKFVVGAVIDRVVQGSTEPVERTETRHWKNALSARSQMRRFELEAQQPSLQAVQADDNGAEPTFTGRQLRRSSNASAVVGVITGMLLRSPKGREVLSGMNKGAKVVVHRWLDTASNTGKDDVADTTTKTEQRIDEVDKFTEELRYWFASVELAGTRTEQGHHVFSGPARRMWNKIVHDARTPIVTVIRALIDGHADGDNTLRDFTYLLLANAQDRLNEVLIALWVEGCYKEFREIFLATKDLPNWGAKAEDSDTSADEPSTPVTGAGDTDGTDDSSTGTSTRARLADKGHAHV